MWYQQASIFHTHARLRYSKIIKQIAQHVSVGDTREGLQGRGVRVRGEGVAQETHGQEGTGAGSRSGLVDESGQLWEIRALEALGRALMARGPGWCLRCGVGRHVPSLMLKGRLLVQVLVRRSAICLEHIRLRPELLYLPPRSDKGVAEIGVTEIMAEAEACFRRVVECESTNCEALTEWALLLLRVGNWRECQRLVQHGLRAADALGKGGNAHKAWLLSILGSQLYYQGVVAPKLLALYCESSATRQ